MKLKLTDKEILSVYWNKLERSNVSKIKLVKTVYEIALSVLPLIKNEFEKETYTKTLKIMEKYAKGKRTIQECSDAFCLIPFESYAPSPARNCIRTALRAPFTGSLVAVLILTISYAAEALNKKELVLFNKFVNLNEIIKG